VLFDRVICGDLVTIIATDLVEGASKVYWHRKSGHKSTRIKKMRGILILAMLAGSLAYAASHDYVEARDMILPAEGLADIHIKAGQGDLELTGVEGASDIVVTATISVPTRTDSKARSIIKSDMVLTLEQDGDSARLASYFKRGKWGWDGHPEINLDVKIPARLAVSIDDGSGLIRIQDVSGDITIEDGSGSIAIVRVGGDVHIDDGSGAISVKEVSDSVWIVDGSGSITVRTVGGSVVIDDGSGSIDVSDVENDLIIEADGSGSLRVARVHGRIEKPN